MIHFNLLYIFVLLFGCSAPQKPLSLHNYPMLNDECPSLVDRSIDNEQELRAKAKLANMSYVNYLHYLSNQPKRDYKTFGAK
mgnify:CR=1 FL=1|jgi:hypothetical protein